MDINPPPLGGNAYPNMNAPLTQMNGNPESV